MNAGKIAAEQLLRGSRGWNHHRAKGPDQSGDLPCRSLIMDQILSEMFADVCHAAATRSIKKSTQYNRYSDNAEPRGFAHVSFILRACFLIPGADQRHSEAALQPECVELLRCCVRRAESVTDVASLGCCLADVEANLHSPLFVWYAL